MEFLLDPNIAYLLLVAGTFFVLMAIAIPGTGIPEVLAVFSIVLAGYAVYHLSLNWWALALLLLSGVPFFFAVRGPRREIWLVVSILGLIAGSLFFFPSGNGLISVNPLLAVVTSVLYAGFLWISARKVTQIAQTRPMHELSGLVGLKGEAKTTIQVQGSVQVGGELWSARSEKPIAVGSAIRVIGREGFVLIVEKDGSI
jgi:membrane-bound serine protease (ClpP class)